MAKRPELGKARGRPVALNAAMTKALTDAIKMGCSDRLACESAGISPATYYDYMARGEAGEVPFVEFLEQVKAAKSRIASLMVSVRTKAAMGGDWRAAESWLRTHRRDECAADKVEVTGANGGPVQIDLKAEIAAQLATVSDKEVGIPDDL